MTVVRVRLVSVPLAQRCLEQLLLAWHAASVLLVCAPCGAGRTRLVSQALGSAAPVSLTNQPLIESTTLKVVEALSEVQRVSGVHFDIPTDLTQEEAVRILKAQRLLFGNEVRARWSPPMRVELTPLPDTEGLLQSLSSQDGAALLLEADQEIRIREHRIPLGRIRTVIRSARLTDPGRVPERRADGTIILDLSPGANPELLFQPAVSPPNS